MEDLRGYPFDYMSEREQKTVWAVAKLLDGLSIKETKKVIAAIKFSIENDAHYHMPQPVLSQS